MEQLLVRVNDVINTCWLSFTAKVGGGLINVNKEASMQLHFAYLLKNTMDLAVHHADEAVTIELETGIQVNGRSREADIVIKIKKGDVVLFLPIEMKCYKNRTSNKKLRGAQDLFKFGIYEDLHLLESYTSQDYLPGIQLTMTDSRVFAYPTTKAGKSWDYDSSHGTVITNGTLIETPIGGKPAKIELAKSYAFNWTEVNGYYFLKLQAS